MAPARYSSYAIALHWAIALLLAFQLGLGWRMMNLPQGAAVFSSFQLHKSIGFLILALSLLRVGVRIVSPRPAEVNAGPASRLLVRSVHFVLYLIMIGGPITGWIIVSTARIAIPTMLFGTLPVPHLPIDRPFHDLAEQGHSLLAWIGAALIVVHLAGAVHHHFPLRESEADDKDDVIGRMIPAASRRAGNRRKVSLAGGAAVFLLAGFAAPWLLIGGGPKSVLQAEVSLPTAQSAAASDVSAPMSKAEATPATESPSDEPSSLEKEPATWTVVNGGSLGFVATMNGAAINGRFDRWDADIQFDPEALDRSRIVVRIPLLSAATGDSSRDEMLKGPSFFGSAGASATFRSTTLRRLSGDRYVAAGTLTMNGRSRPISLAFSLVINGERATVSGSSELDRTVFGIGSGEWASTDQIAAKVRLNFAFDANRTK